MSKSNQLQFCPLQFSQDIRQILTGSTEGERILESLDEETVITIKDRRCLVRILLSHVVERFGDRYFKIVFSFCCFCLLEYYVSLNLLSVEKVRQDTTHVQKHTFSSVFERC